MFNAYKVRPYRWDGYTHCVEASITGKRERKFFKSEREAKTWAELKNIELANSGLNALSIGEEMRVQVQRSLLLLEPYGRTLEEAVRTAVKVFEGEQSSVTVRDAIDSLIETKRDEGRSKRYLQDLKHRLGKFSDYCGDQYISMISMRDIKAFLAGLGGSGTTKNNMRRCLSVLYAQCVEMEWCESNIISRIRSTPRKSLEIGILTPEEAKGLLENACDLLKPYLAIGLFAGLRRSELLRIKPNSIHWASNVIRVDVTKTGASRRFIRIRTNLRAWLEMYRLEPLTPHSYRIHLDAARTAAEIFRWPNNAMRHSFCSYALAGEKQLNELVLEMGHTNAQTLFQYYRELVSEEQARTFWAIQP